LGNGNSLIMASDFDSISHPDLVAQLKYLKTKTYFCLAPG